jgi:hypothetical protein
VVIEGQDLRLRRTQRIPYYRLEDLPTWEQRLLMTSTTPSSRVDPGVTRGRARRFTDEEFQRRNERAIVCPITSNKGSTKLRAGLKVRDAVLADEVRTLGRRAAFAVDRVPQDILNDARGRLAALLGINVIAVSRESVGLQIEE